MVNLSNLFSWKTSDKSAPTSDQSQQYGPGFSQDYVQNMASTGKDIQSKIDQHISNQTQTKTPTFDLTQDKSFGPQVTPESLANRAYSE